MNVDEAVRLAKIWVFNTFQDENIINVGLEEIDFDESLGRWKVTVGFSRPWDQSRGPIAVLGGPSSSRSYKVVVLNDFDGKVISLRNREPAA